MADNVSFELISLQEKVCQIVSEQLGIPTAQALPSSRLIEDLHCDSLDMVELLMELEDEFHITIPDEPSDAVGKSVFTRRPIRLSDLAELVYLYRGSGRPERKSWWGRNQKELENVEIEQEPAPPYKVVPFSQLSGRWDSESMNLPNFEFLCEEEGIKQYRRRIDGMRCFVLPGGEIRIGSDREDAHPDEQPCHTVGLNSFVMDAEPVSTSAFCRFLNSVEPSEAWLKDWFQLTADDDRASQMQIVFSGGRWHPIDRTEHFPMVLVSWFGANAYSLWANGADWRQYDCRDSFLPSEAQWEYAAQGAYCLTSTHATGNSFIVSNRHVPGTTYTAQSMLMLPVNHAVGVSKFGLHHMAGNVWQWCRDWYSENFYQQSESGTTDPVNSVESGVRSERGGSWVGPAELCRTTYRRGRHPAARGRCLGFRCTSPIRRLP